MKKLFNLFAFIFFTISAMADGNITIKKSNSYDDPSLVLKVGPEKVKLQEFESIFYKNNNEEIITKDYVNEYTNLFIDFKRKVLYAEENKMDTSSSFKKELAGYRNQLSKSYLNDTKVTEELLKEAYEIVQKMEK